MKIKLIASCRNVDFFEGELQVSDDLDTAIRETLIHVWGSESEALRGFKEEMNWMDVTDFESVVQEVKESAYVAEEDTEYPGTYYLVAEELNMVVEG